ncbi:hypothetical protein ACWCPQ_14295 [Nocardia sp. NPDC001965]
MTKKENDAQKNGQSVSEQHRRFFSLPTAETPQEEDRRTKRVDE